MQTTQREQSTFDVPKQKPSLILVPTLQCDLAEYSTWNRILDTSALFVFALINIYLLYKSLPLISLNLFAFVATILTALISADLISGIVHWSADTWGNPSWPIIGKALIRPFREHHVDQEAITRHDFVEANGANALVSLLVIVPTLVHAHFIDENYVLWLFSATLTIFVLLTSQVHKWAHTEESKRSKLILWAQKTKIILNPDHHQKHHRFPFDNYYCITTGWLNKPLLHIKLFRVLEKIITKVTKAQPRKDDLKWVVRK